MASSSIIPADAPPAPSILRSLAPLLILSLSVGAGFMMLQSFGIMAETAKHELKLSDAAIGFIQGGSAAVPLVLFSIPLGILVDRHNRVRLMIFLSLTWTLGTFMTAFGPNASILFIARMLTGIGTTGALTAVLSLAADLCRPEQRGRAMLIPTVGKTIGIAAGFAVAGALLGVFMGSGAPTWFGALSSWRSAQLALGVVSAILTLPLFFLSEPPRHEVESASTAPFRVVMRELWERRGFLVPLFIGQATVVMADAAAGIWASPVLERSYHLRPAVFGQWLGAIVLVTGIVGALAGGLVADWGQKSGRRGGLLIGAVAAAAIGVPAALFPIMPSATGFALMIGLLLFAGTITGLIASVALTVLIPNELRGLSIGAFIAFAGLIGFGIAPSLVAWVSEFLGGEQHLGPALAIVGTIVSLASVAGFALAMRHAPSTATDHHN